MYRSKILVKLFLVVFLMIFSLSGFGMDRFSVYSPVNPLPYDTLPDGKIILQWREITPYVYMEKVCEAKKVFLIYSSINSLTLQTDQGVITPSEYPVVHELIRKKAGTGETSTQMIMRYAFCVGDEVTAITIKNGKSESLPILIDSAFISRNVGLVIHEDKDYMDAMARAIEQAETQRSMALESVKFYVPQENTNGEGVPEWDPEEAYVYDNQNYYGQNSNQPVSQNITNTEEPVEEIPEEYVDEVVEEQAVVKHTPEKEKTPVKKEMVRKEIEKEEIPIEKIDPVVFANFSKETFVTTTDRNVAIDYEKVAQGKNGNGYKVQIIAKLLSDHNAKSIQQYYGLNYAVEEHYDGVWRRYTISGYSGNWDETFVLLQEIRRDFGIDDAFISLYQDHERLGIYPCNTVGFAEWVQAKTENPFEPFGSKTEYLAQQIVSR